MALSEDPTRIDGRIQYDSKTNLIEGFVLPIDEENGMPVPYSYKARNAAEMLSYFSSNKPVAQFVTVIMAQPLANVAPFCLLLYIFITRMYS